MKENETVEIELRAGGKDTFRRRRRKIFRADIEEILFVQYEISVFLVIPVGADGVS